MWCLVGTPLARDVLAGSLCTVNAMDGCLFLRLSFHWVMRCSKGRGRIVFLKPSYTAIITPILADGERTRSTSPCVTNTSVYRTPWVTAVYADTPETTVQTPTCRCVRLQIETMPWKINIEPEKAGTTPPGTYPDRLRMWDRSPREPS